MTDYLLYRGRSGAVKLVKKTQANWDYLVEEMEQDNRVTLVEMLAVGDRWEGSFAEGYMFIDDGGRIDTVELTEVPENEYVHYH